jgi:glycosyltransferase involved in cell wall biosynthesis
MQPQHSHSTPAGPSVLQLTISFQPGGRRNAILSLARRLKEQRTQSDLVCIDELGCEPALVADFGEVECLERPSSGTLSAVAQLVRFCDRRGVNIIHAHDAASQYLAYRTRLTRRHIKILMTFHRSLGFESAGLKAKFRNALAGLATKAVVVGSQERRDHYLKENYFPASKVVRIPFGADLHRFKPDLPARTELRQELGIAENNFMVGAAGHFGSEKGIDLAIQSFLAFRSSHPQARLLVIGRGTPDQETSIRNLAQQAGEAVHVVGWRADIERCFAAMDTFLHLPRQEAFGLVIIEAMACGLPVVAANVGGIPDIVRDGHNGLLVPSNDLQAAAAGLRQLATDDAHRAKLASQAFQTAETEFSDTLYANRYLNLYRAILAGVAPRKSSALTTDIQPALSR